MLAAPDPRAQPQPQPVPERRAPLPIALAAYTTEAVLLGLVRGTALTAAIALIAFVLAR